jgi:plastocyanin
MKPNPTILAIGILLSAGITNVSGVTNIVQIGNYFFNPTNITISPGDYIRWTNTVPLNQHDTTRTGSNSWASPLFSGATTFLLRFTNVGNFPYYCNQHVFVTPTKHPEQTGTVSVIAANLPPSVSLTNPANDAKFRAPTNLVLHATAIDDGTVTNVEFFSGATLLGHDPIAPFSFTLNNAAASNYTFTARAHDNGGLSATSPPINVFVLTNALLTSPTRLPDGQFRFTVQGIAGQTYAAENSSNLTFWSPFVTNVAPANTFNITDTTATNILQRFYRTRQDL